LSWRRPKSASTVDHVSTVESTSETKARIGGNCLMRPLLASRSMDAWISPVISVVCWPAKAGNELYLNGLYSGWMSIQRDWAK
jgi:hypothetical protein